MNNIKIIRRAAKCRPYITPIAIFKLSVFIFLGKKIQELFASRLFFMYIIEVYHEINNPQIHRHCEERSDEAIHTIITI
jgi:hypothetical protein